MSTYFTALFTLLFLASASFGQDLNCRELLARANQSVQQGETDREVVVGRLNIDFFSEPLRLLGIKPHRSDPEKQELVAVLSFRVILEYEEDSAPVARKVATGEVELRRLVIDPQSSEELMDAIAAIQRLKSKIHEEGIDLEKLNRAENPVTQGKNGLAIRIQENTAQWMKNMQDDTLETSLMDYIRDPEVPFHHRMPVVIRLPFSSEALPRVSVLPDFPFGMNRGRGYLPGLIRPENLSLSGYPKTISPRRVLSDSDFEQLFSEDGLIDVLERIQQLGRRHIQSQVGEHAGLLDISVAWLNVISHMSKSQKVLGRAYRVSRSLLKTHRSSGVSHESLNRLEKVSLRLLGLTVMNGH